MKAGIIESKKYTAAPVIVQPNTFIGGVANSIPSKAALASKLNILESDISVFNIVGNDIEAKIDVDYANLLFYQDANITYFKEKNEGRCIGLNSANAFAQTPNLIEVEFLRKIIINQLGFSQSGLKRGLFHNVETLDYFSVFASTETDLLYFPKLKYRYSSTGNDTFGKCKNLYIPLAEEIGGTHAKNNCFLSAKQYFKIWANPLLQTSNNGGEEGDLAYARNSKFAVITYGANPNILQLPNAVNDLDAGIIKGTSVQLNFTPPGPNDIEYYKVYVNSVFKQNIKDPGGYVTELELDTQYLITIKAVDIFNVESELSNEISVRTATIKSFKYPNELSFFDPAETHCIHNFENSTADFLGNYDGTPNNIIYETVEGLITAKFNGSNSYVALPDAAGYNTTMTIMFWGRSLSGVYYGKGEDAYGGWGLRLYDGTNKFQSWVVTLSPVAGWALNSSERPSINGVKLNHYAFVYDNEHNEFRMYVNGVFCGQDLRPSDGLRGTQRVFLGKYTSQYLNGNMAAFSIIKRALPEIQIQEAAAM